MIEQVAGTSILGRALSSGVLSLDVINIRDFSVRKTGRVDDYPYGGGAGMVMEPEPVYRAVQKAKEAAGENARVIYLTPAAPVLTQTKVEELAKEEDLILLCGHYEGIDERVLQTVVTDNLSIGDYVLTGGELGACVLMDAVSRFVPGVLSNEESAMFESLQDNLLEYPQYTRPEVWQDQAVPEVLLSGDHKKIEEWRHEQSLLRTKERRPDLLEKSYRVNVLHFGSDENTAFAEKLAQAASRYAQMLDYNRNKLRKQKKRFGASDLVLVVTDRPDEAPAALEKVSAHGSPAAVVLCDEGDPDNEAARWISGLLAERGFHVLNVYDRKTGVEDIALEIRRETDTL